VAIVTTQGKEWVIDKVQDLAPLSNALMRHVWWGTGAVAEAVGNTFSNVTEATEARTLGTLTQPTTTTDRVVGMIQATGTKGITESGRTNTATKGDAGERLYMRALFTSVPVENTDQITFTHDVVAT
jgi:hypothetical protein